MEIGYVIKQENQEYSNDDQIEAPSRISSKKNNKFNALPTGVYNNSAVISLTSQEIIAKIGEEIDYSRDSFLDFQTFKQIDDQKNVKLADVDSQISSYQHILLEELNLIKRNEWVENRKTCNKEDLDKNKAKNFFSSLPQPIMKKNSEKSSKPSKSQNHAKNRESSPEILTRPPKIKNPSNLQKGEIKSTGDLPGKNLELIERRSASEGALNRNESMLSFRDHILTNRREKQIDQIIKNEKNRPFELVKENDQLKYKDTFDIKKYDIIHDKKEEKDYNKNLFDFIKNKFHIPKCSVAILSKLFKSIMEDEIYVQTEQKRLQKAEAWAAAKPSRTEELIEIVQNMLLPMSPLYERTKNIQLYQIEYMEAQKLKITTVWSVMLFEATLGLTEIKASPKKGKNHPLISFGINLNTYLMIWDRIDRFIFKPSSKVGVDLKDKKIVSSNILLKSMLSFICDDNIKSVLDFLKRLNDVNYITKTVSKKIIKFTHTSMEHQNIPGFKHLWDEPIDYLSNDLDSIKPYDNTSHKELVDSFVKNNEAIPSKILINGEVIFEKKINAPISRDELFLKIFTGLYRNFGFKIPGYKSNELSLEGQISMLVIDSYKNCGGYTEQMQHCIRLLKAGSRSQARTDDYFMHRFKKFCETYKLVDNELIYNIWINKNNPDDYSFERLKVSSVSGENKVNMTLSWKVASPKNDKWPCVLRISKLALGPNVSRHEVKKIFNSLLVIQPDDVIQEGLSEKGINIEHKFNLKLANQKNQ